MTKRSVATRLTGLMPKVALGRRKNLSGTAVALLGAPLMIAAPSSVHAAVVTGYFSGVAGTITPSAIDDTAGFEYNSGDTLAGSFSFDPSNYVATFTAAISDLTTGESFVMPVGAATSGSASIPSSTAYDILATDHLISDPGHEDQTSYYVTLTLDLTGSGLTTGDFSQNAILNGGTGSLYIDIPAENPYPEETLTVPFTELSATIPEPASVAALGAGLIGLTFVRRRAKR